MRKGQKKIKKYEEYVPKNKSWRDSKGTFVKIPRLVLAYKHLSPRARHLLMVLQSHDMGSIKFPAGYVFMSGRYLAKKLGVSVWTISKTMQECYKSGFVSRLSPDGDMYHLYLQMPIYDDVSEFVRDFNILFYHLRYEDVEDILPNNNNIKDEFRLYFENLVEVKNWADDQRMEHNKGLKQKFFLHEWFDDIEKHALSENFKNNPLITLVLV